MSEELYKQMAQSIIDGEEEIAAELARAAIAEGLDPLEAITQGYMPGVNTVGDSFACGQAFLPELVMAGEAMKAAIAVLEPEMKKTGAQRQILGVVVLANDCAVQVAVGVDLRAAQKTVLDKARKEDNKRTYIFALAIFAIW